MESAKDLDAQGEKSLAAAIEEFKKTTALLDVAKPTKDSKKVAAPAEKAEPPKSLAGKGDKQSSDGAKTSQKKAS
jgi:hypothetical protein